VAAEDPAAPAGPGVGQDDRTVLLAQRQGLAVAADSEPAAQGVGMDRAAPGDVPGDRVAILDRREQRRPIASERQADPEPFLAGMVGVHDCAETLAADQVPEDQGAAPRSGRENLAVRAECDVRNDVVSTGPPEPAGDCAANIPQHQVAP
jgi:hypothetical protein